MKTRTIRAEFTGTLDQHDNDGSSCARNALAKLGISGATDTPYGTRAETSLRYVLGEPMINCAIVGLAELDHLRQVLIAAAAGPLPKDAMDLLR